MRQKTPRFTLIILLILTLLTACAPAAETPAENTPVPTATPEPTPDAVTQELIDMFGSSCVPEHTQQLTLDGFDGEVWFVPYRPFHSYAYAQIIQNGEVLAQLNSRVHEGLGGDKFSGLGSVAFRDLNGDGKTDIVMIELFGDERFASLFFSAPEDTDTPEERFYRDDELEKELEDRADFCSVPLTAEWAADMVRIAYDGSLEISGWAGGFDDWQTAYRAAAERFEQSCTPEDLYYGIPQYSLIDVDGDDVPELAAAIGDGHYYIKLYTFRNGTLYTPMELWWYDKSPGYRPGENIIRFSVYGILCSIYYYTEIGADGELHTTAVLNENYFADTNDNGILDEPIKHDYTDKNGNGEYDCNGDELNYTYWLNGEKISHEEFDSWVDDGFKAYLGEDFDGCGWDPSAYGYEEISPALSLDELMTLLNGYEPD